MDLFKGNRNRIKKIKANEITFNINSLLILVTHSKQTKNKPMVPRREDDILMELGET